MEAIVDETGTVIGVEYKKAIYCVPEQNIAHLMAQVTRLNKRCTKLGIPLITISYKHDYNIVQYRYAPMGQYSETVQWFDENEVRVGWVPTGKVRAMLAVKVDGAAPKYAGWRFLATLEPLATEGKETLNLVMAVPGEKCPTEYMKPEHVGVCGHCKAKRLRKQTFVVQHDDGRCMAVGRQCIKDFLGHQDPNKLAAWAELLIELGSIGSGSEDEEWLGGGHREEPAWDLEYYLAQVAAVTREFGWMSRTRAKQQFHPTAATVDTVNEILNPPVKFYTDKDRRDWEILCERCKPTDADKAEAVAGLEWALGLDIEKLLAAGGADNYLANVAAIARARVVRLKTCGLGGSILAAAARAKGEAEKAAVAASKPPSQPVGTVGVRAEYRVRCDRVIPREGDFGCTYITRLSVWDETHKVYAYDMVWFASTNHGMVEGKCYGFKATVKAHEQYNGRTQTVVQRGAVGEEITGE